MKRAGSLKVLVVTPGLNTPGGVSEFNKMLLQYSSHRLKPFVLWGSGKNYSPLVKKVLFLINVFRYSQRLLIGKPDIVHLGPSLGKNAIRRDATFTWIAKNMNIKVFIHWHGWNPANEKLLESGSLKSIKDTIFRADHIKFLSPSFESVFIRKGFMNRTSVGKTFIDDAFMPSGYTERTKEGKIKILFLSTVSQNKGIYIAIEVFKALAKKYNVQLIVAGTGPETERLKSIIEPKYSDRVIFLGHVSGNLKTKAFQDCHLYIFPSYYEGMPTSVIEAMGNGLPVVCSNVGAIPDFFQDNRMGTIINGHEVPDYVSAIEKLITDEALRIKMGRFNHAYVKDHFLASDAIHRIDQDYSSLIQNHKPGK